MSTFCITPQRHGRTSREIKQPITPNAKHGITHPPRVEKRIDPNPRRSARHRADVKLQQVEDAVLASILDRHPVEDAALSRLLDDIDALPVSLAQPQPLPDVATFTPRQLARIEQLLIAVALGSHKRRDTALNELLEDFDNENRERDAFDMECDNDPDGMA